MPAVSGRAGVATDAHRRPAAALARASGWAARAVRVLETPAGGWTALGAVMVIAAILFLWLTRGTTFWIDELYFFAGNKGFDPKYLVTPHNGQFILVPRLIYATVFELFGADYVVFRLIELAGVLAVAGLVYALARRRIGGALALAPAVLMLFFGSSWSVVLPAVGIINIYCVAGGLGAMLALERGGRWSDPLAALLLFVSLACWSPGLAFAAGAAVMVLRSPDRWPRLWVVAIPLGLYALWWVTKPGLTGPLYGSLSAHAVNVLLVPNFIVTSIGSVAAAVTGLDYGFSQPAVVASGATPDYFWGPTLAALAAFGLFVALRRSPRKAWPWQWFAALIVFWLSTALAFSPGSRTPATGRYVYVGAAVALVLAASVAGRYRARPKVVVAVFAIVLLALGANIAMLRDASLYLRSYASAVRADFTAVELARPYVAPTFVPSAGAISAPLLTAATNAGTYLAAVDRNGSFADTLPELRSAPEGDREEADRILAEAIGVGLVPVAPPADLGRCRRVGATPGLPTTVQLPRGGAVLRAGGSTAPTVTLRRFASVSTASVGQLATGRYYALKVPVDAAPDPWWMQLDPSTPLTLCPP